MVQPQWTVRNSCVNCSNAIEMSGSNWAFRHSAKEGSMENRIEMTQHDRDVLVVMKAVLQGERTQDEAGGYWD